MKHKTYRCTYKSNTSKQLNTCAFMLNFGKTTLQTLLDIFLEILSSPKNTMIGCHQLKNINPKRKTLTFPKLVL